MPVKTLRKGRRNARQTRRVGGGKLGLVLAALAAFFHQEGFAKNVKPQTALANFANQPVARANPEAMTYLKQHTGDVVAPLLANPNIPVSEFIPAATYNSGASVVTPPAARVNINKYNADGKGPKWVPSTLHGQTVPKQLEGSYTHELGEQPNYRSRLSPANAYSFPRGWKGPGNGYVRKFYDPEPGKTTRYNSNPEVQTWNPYVTGDPEAMVDYFEGYTPADKQALIDKFHGGVDPGWTVRRQDTPMYTLASLVSTEVPEYNPSNLQRSKLQYLSWALKARSSGMKVPLTDPRAAVKKTGLWGNMPNFISEAKVLRTQLEKHNKAPRNLFSGSPNNWRAQTIMRSGTSRAFPQEARWTGSSLTVPEDQQKELYGAI